MHDWEHKRDRINAEGGFMSHNGIVVTVIEDGYCECQVDMDNNGTNPYSIAHGGLLFSICDSAAGVAAETQGYEVVTRACSMHFLRPAKHGIITAKGRIVQKSRRIAFCTTELVDEDGELLASASFDMYYLDSVSQD